MNKTPEELADELGMMWDQCAELREQLAVERKRSEALTAFAREAFATALDGGTWDGADIQEKGAELGLLREEPFDPEKHPGVDASEFEPGEIIYVFTELMRGRDEIAAGGSHDR